MRVHKLRLKLEPHSNQHGDMIRWQVEVLNGGNHWRAIAPIKAIDSWGLADDEEQATREAQVFVDAFRAKEQRHLERDSQIKYIDL